MGKQLSCCLNGTGRNMADVAWLLAGRERRLSAVQLCGYVREVLCVALASMFTMLCFLITCGVVHTGSPSKCRRVFMLSYLPLACSVVHLAPRQGRCSEFFRSCD